MKTATDIQYSTLTVLTDNNAIMQASSTLSLSNIMHIATYTPQLSPQKQCAMSLKNTASHTGSLVNPPKITNKYYTK